METINSIGRVRFKVRYIRYDVNVEAIAEFDDRGDDIYYCWHVSDNSGQQIASKCLPIAKRIIDTNILDYCINHAKVGIENFKINRQNIFEITEWEVF